MVSGVVSEWPLDPTIARSGETKATRRADGTFAPGVIQPGAIPFVPGCKAGPGRPAGYSLLTPILRKLAANHNGFDEGQLAEAVADALLAKALEGDPKVLAMLLDRVDGAVVKEINSRLLDLRESVKLSDGDAPPVALPVADEDGDVGNAP